MAKNRTGNVIQFKNFSPKQLRIFTWWKPGSPYRHYNGIIADGAIRAGKTVPMALSFVFWAMEEFDHQNFAMCGKSIGAFKRNVWNWLKPVLIKHGYVVEELRSINFITIKYRGNTNFFYIFGGKDESSQDLIQGITLAGIYFDEVALQPESFVLQGTGRCSVAGSKYWFNCNPEGPEHWFNKEWIKKSFDKKLFHQHHVMDDNPSLSEEIKQKYRSMYSGVFFKRFILGLWVVARGAIYDMFGDRNRYSENGPDFNLWYKRYYSIDYGTTNPFVVLEIIEQNGFYFVDDELYYDSRTENRQKEDAEYVQDLLDFIGNKRYTTVIVDPSANSFKVAAKKRGIRMKDADNDVLDGIRLVASLFASGRLRINERCTHTLAEIVSYVWDEKATEKGVERPVKSADHGCLAGNTLIETADGEFKIQDLVGKVGWLQCFDGVSMVKRLFYNVSLTEKDADVFTIKLANGDTVTATGSHPFLTQRGWVKLEDLRLTDSLMRRK